MDFYQQFKYRFILGNFNQKDMNSSLFENMPNFILFITWNNIKKLFQSICQVMIGYQSRAEKDQHLFYDIIDFQRHKTFDY